ncbi:MAG: hypothetical protein KJO31_15845 [Gammaproteobacteria bacterium]|nr:hypothetical protein [Gammaproteobacteria bacterium]
MSATNQLVTIKAVHTVIWAIFATAILAIPFLAWADMYRHVIWITSFIMLEIIILAVNRWQCPLTGIAARYTDDRRDNFDIYLPLWLARHNKLIFGSLFVIGQAIVILKWRGWVG